MPDLVLDIDFNIDAMDLDVEFEDLSLIGTFDIDFNETYGGGDIPTYAGSYVVTPKTVSQTLDCADMRMAQDLLVKKIPVLSVSNPQGGITVSIGE